MPINNSAMDAIQKRYGSKKGSGIYFALENSGKKSFKKGLKTATKEGHTSKDFSSYKKGRRKRSGRKSSGRS